MPCVLMFNVQICVCMYICVCNVFYAYTYTHVLYHVSWGTPLVCIVHVYYLCLYVRIA